MDKNLSIFFWFFREDKGLGWLQSSKMLTSDINLFKEFGEEQRRKIN